MVLFLVLVYISFNVIFIIQTLIRYMLRNVENMFQNNIVALIIMKYKRFVIQALN